MDNVSEDEQLPVTSRINGITYNRFDVQECFECNGPFTDEHGLLRLSDIQNQCFQHWLRPDKFSRSLLDSPRVVHSVGPAFIIQTFTHDCSFVASLTSCAQYELRFGKPLLTSKIFPKNSTSKPIYNPCGKYVIRLSVNGAWRKVVIDDLFPVGEKKKLLCSHSRNGDIWVSLLEKAYMKVMGGYDIADSFPHIDTHVLTGWIPECVPVNMESKDFSAKLMYEGIYRWFNRGQCLFNIATGEISKSESERMGLPQFHTYAVIELRKFKDKRFLLLKDPSIHPSSSWKGKYSDADLESWTSELCEALRHYPTAAQQLRDGMFWIDYESVCHFFDFFYLNWNPRIFPYSFGLHAQWSVVANSAKDLNIGVDNPQYSLEIIGNGRPCAVWILLTRHIVERDDFPTSEGSIGVVIFKLRDESDSLITSPPILYPNFTRTSHLLTKMAVREAGIYSYLLVVAQKEKLRTIRYTLRIYSAVQFRLRKVKKSYTFEKLEIGKWKGKSVGGSGNGLSKATYRFPVKLSAKDVFNCGGEFCSNAFLLAHCFN